MAPRRIQQSPLGDAKALMHSLEQAFTAMAHQKQASASSNS